jgi:hypothetical protein
MAKSDKYTPDKWSSLDEFFDALQRQDSVYLDYARTRRREYFKAIGGLSVVDQVKSQINIHSENARLINLMVY